MVEPALFGPLDVVLAPVIEFVLLGLVVVNMGTRLIAYRTHRSEAADGAESLSRVPLHETSNVVLVLATFYFTTLEPHAGTVLSVIVLGTVIADFFEFEGRQVELRQDWTIEPPKAAIAGSLIALTYAAYQAVFFLLQPFWELVV